MKLKQNVCISLSNPLPTSGYNPPAPKPSFDHKGGTQVETFYEIEHGGQKNTGRGDTSGMNALCLSSWLHFSVILGKIGQQP